MRGIRNRRQQLLAAFLMGLVLALLAGSRVSRAEGPVQPGIDISWPQCGMALPRSVEFAIVGVNGGKAFTSNDCLRQQYDWARGIGSDPAVYINLNYTDRVTLHTIAGPAGICAPRDERCTAYNYGWNAARDAVATGRSQGVTAREWWLDVETENRWSEHVELNTRVVAGAIDYLSSQNLQPGIYSTPYQWGEITGKFAPGLPVWTAGAGNLADAQKRCTGEFAFGGGRVRLVQYIEKFDTNWVCPN